MYFDRSVSSPAGTIKVSVLMDGVEQPLWRRPWDNKIFVVGKPGQAFTLRVENLTPGRIEVISTVDGLNTLDDQPGDVRCSRGFLVYGERERTVESWWQSDLQARQLTFGTPDRRLEPRNASSTKNVGVIGFAVYREQSAFGFGTAQIGNGLLGDGSSFLRDGNGADLLVIGYDTVAFLRQQGVVVPPEPIPFPGIQIDRASNLPLAPNGRTLAVSPEPIRGLPNAPTEE